MKKPEVISKQLNPGMMNNPHDGCITDMGQLLWYDTLQ